MLVILPVKEIQAVQVAEWNERDQVVCNRETSMPNPAGSLEMLICIAEGNTSYSWGSKCENPNLVDVD